jgi:hypothetical protein
MPLVLPFSEETDVAGPELNEKGDYIELSWTIQSA